MISTFVNLLFYFVNKCAIAVMQRHTWREKNDKSGR